MPAVRVYPTAGSVLSNRVSVGTVVADDGWFLAVPTAPFGCTETRPCPWPRQLEAAYVGDEKYTEKAGEIKAGTAGNRAARGTPDLVR